jgi:mono/diheme cytochrome c family protein
MRRLLIFAIALVCIVDFSGCATTFAPPSVTTELARTGSGQHADIVVLREGRNLFVSRCIECHTLPPFWHYRAEDWPHIVDTMAERAKLKRAERDAIVAYILGVRAQ